MLKINLVSLNNLLLPRIVVYTRAPRCGGTGIVRGIVPVLLVVLHTFTWMPAEGAMALRDHLNFIVLHVEQL